jgi:hypothetical protein
MKKLIVILSIAMSFQFGVTQHFTNTGEIYINPNTHLSLSGDFENLDWGYIKNEGDMDLTGDWVNNSSTTVNMNGFAGSVHFNGSATQDIKGSAETDFVRLSIENNVALGESAFVWDMLSITGGKLNLGNKDLHYQNGFTPIVADANHYIIAEGDGKLIYFVDNMSPAATIPIGIYEHYTPVNINVNSVSDNYSFNMIKGVLENGSSGANLAEIDDCVNLTWNICPENIPTADYDITLYWNEVNENADFERTKSAIGYYHAGQWNANTSSAAGGADPYTQTLSDLHDEGNFAVGDMDSPMAVTLDVIVDVNAFLEGPFNGIEMLTHLNDANYIPLNQPYNTDPWFYTGIESLAAIPNNEVIDWVLVEIRDAANAGWAFPATAIEQQAALLLSTGEIVGLDGVSPLQFTQVIAQNMFVVIYHRNHLSVMSADPVPQVAGVYTYDFTDAANKAYSDGAPGQKEIAAGIWGMYGGDGSGAGNITNYDYLNVWKPVAGTKGYDKADYNMDGQVENKDKNDVWLGNNMISTQVPD